MGKLEFKPKSRVLVRPFIHYATLGTIKKNMAGHFKRKDCVSKSGNVRRQPKEPKPSLPKDTREPFNFQGAAERENALKKSNQDVSITSSGKFHSRKCISKMDRFIYFLVGVPNTVHKLKRRISAPPQCTWNKMLRAEPKL